jgi:hypothetical protein
MDLNHFPILLPLVALQDQFECRSKTELRNTIVRDWGKRIYQALLRSSRLLIFPRILNENLWFYIYIWKRIVLNFYYFPSKIDNTQFDQNMAMEDMWWVLYVLQQENNNMRQAFKQLQVGAPSAPQSLEDVGN